VITTVNSININRAPLKEDVLQSAAEEEKEKKWYYIALARITSYKMTTSV
jgi:hypothetical protein